MKHSIIVLFALLVFSNLSYSQNPPLAFCGDLGVFVTANSSYTITSIIETASIPFEGCNEPTGCISTNRVGVFQNGTILREFETSTNGGCIPYDAFINYHKVVQTGNVETHLDLASPFEPDHCNGAWSSAKYKITLIISPSGEKYTFYFNNLDIHYGKSNWYGRNIYGNDWYVRYNINLPLGSRVTIAGKTNAGLDTIYHTISTTDTANGLPTKELKVWEMLYGRTTPFGRTFYASTTPFGISPKHIDDGYSRNFVLGTTVILDTVYKNLGANDKYGYNTVNGGSGFLENYHRYYSRPPIDSTKNDSGNTYTTPAWYYYDNNFHYGTKITAQSGDTLILKRKKALWITGILDRELLNIYRGDTMVFKSGSVRILDPSAEIMTTNGGQVFYEAGSTLIWDEHSCNFAGTGSGISFAGNHTITNGGFFVVDAGGTLTLQDNTTLTFDGTSSVLEVRGSCNIKFGVNSKIVFRNGASIRANGGNFSGINGATWGGLVFENSGQDSIYNCVFNNANKYIDMSLDASSRTSNRKIHNNTFNNGTVKITEATNLIFSNNTFNCQSVSGNTALLEISHLISGLPANPVLNILYNTFKGGTFQLKLNGFAASSVP